MSHFSWNYQIYVHFLISSAIKMLNGKSKIILSKFLEVESLKSESAYEGVNL